MKQFAVQPQQERKEIFNEAAARLGVVPAIVEKDFWVTWVLAHIFEDPDLSQQLMFKGGTSLSKVYGLIERFSEDIDLILDWHQLTDSDPNEQRSKTQDEKLSKQINGQAKDYISTVLLAKLQQIVSPVCSVGIDEDPFVINISYPASFPDRYLRPEIRLEIGPMAAWNPHQNHAITSLVAEQFPKLFMQPNCDVNVILAKRTFWEKATILHAEAHRPQGKSLPMRYSRHYYDLAQMANSGIKDEALTNLELLEQVVDFKQRFYPSGWANYKTATSGTFRLISSEERIEELEQDYDAMHNMIYGNYPSFESLITVLRDLETEINELGC